MGLHASGSVSEQRIAVKTRLLSQAAQVMQSGNRQLVECLPGILKQSPRFNIHHYIKPIALVHICNLIIQNVEARGSEIA